MKLGAYRSFPEFKMPTCHKHFFKGCKWWCKKCNVEVEEQFKEVAEAFWTLQRSVEDEALRAAALEDNKLAATCSDKELALRLDDLSSLRCGFPLNSVNFGSGECIQDYPCPKHGFLGGVPLEGFRAMDPSPSDEDGSAEFDTTTQAPFICHSCGQEVAVENGIILRHIIGSIDKLHPTNPNFDTSISVVCSGAGTRFRP